MQVGVIHPGQNVVVIDDLIATGKHHLVYVLKKPLSQSNIQEVPPQPRVNSSPSKVERPSNMYS